MNQIEKLRLLVVDHSAVLRRRLLEMIAPLPGIEICGAATDVPTAIAAGDKLKPQVVILDLEIPGGGGLDVLAHLRRASPPPVVIVFTNFNYEPLRRYCRSAGAEYFFDKSTDAEAMLTVLGALPARASAKETA